MPSSQAKPSPHRFVTPAKRPADTRSGSSLRNQSSSFSKPTPFTPAPRFSVRPTRATTDDELVEPAPSSPLAARARRVSVRPPRGEDIEDHSSPSLEAIHAARSDQEDPDGLMLLTDSEQPKESMEKEPLRKRHRSRKRPRSLTNLSSSSSSPSPTPSPPSSPSAQTSLAATTTTTRTTLHLNSHPQNRFLFAPHHPQPSIPSQPTQSSHRPAFILPPSTAPNNNTAVPLPEVFSPQKNWYKTEKYVPDGLASTLREWVLEVGYGTAAKSLNAGEGEFPVQIRTVEDVRAGAGVVLVSEVPKSGVRGEEDDDEEMLDSGVEEEMRRGQERRQAGEGGTAKWILVASKRADVLVRKGDKLGVKRPTWDVQLGEEKWNVGVEWKVL